MRGKLSLSPVASHKEPIIFMSSTDEFLHVSLAATLSAEIERGLWSRGQRLPSVRQLGKSHGVSVTTVLAAYRLLEDRRLIEARPQKGFYVCSNAHPLTAPESLILRAERVDESLSVEGLQLLNEPPGLVSFGTALCAKALFPVDALGRSIAATARKQRDLLVEVSFSPGSNALRQSIASHASTWNCQLAPDDLLITNGCVEAFGLCLQAVARPGDVIVVESPAFYGFLSTIARLGMIALPLSFFPDPTRALAEIARVAAERRVGACLVSTSVSNPSGLSMTTEAKQALVNSLDRLGVPLIEDATFSDLHFDAVQRAAKSYDRTGNVLLCSSLTKTLAPGLRIGWVAGGRHQDTLVSLKRTMSIGQPLLIQEGVAAYLRTGGYHYHLRQLRKKCQSQVEQTANLVLRHFPVGTQVSMPSGGYLLWVQLPESVLSMDVYRIALREGITIAPGNLFAPDDRFINYMRLNCGGEIDHARSDALVRLGAIACTLA